MKSAACSFKQHFLLSDSTSLSPGSQSSHILRRTTSTMKDRIYSSDTEKWVFTAVSSVCLCLLLFYCFILLSAEAPECLHFSTPCLLPLFSFFFSLSHLHLIFSTRYTLYLKGVITVRCVHLYVCIDNSSCLPIGRGGADLRGLAQYLLGPAATNQASDAGWPRAYPTATLLHVLALGLQSGQSRVRGPDGSCYISLTGNDTVIHSRSAGADIDYVV